MPFKLAILNKSNAKANLHWQKCEWYHGTIMPPLLAFSSLGGATQMASFMFVECGQGQ